MNNTEKLIHRIWDRLEQDTNIYKIAMGNNRMTKIDMMYIDAVEASILDLYNVLNKEQ